MSSDFVNAPVMVIGDSWVKILEENKEITQNLKKINFNFDCHWSINTTLNDIMDCIKQKIQPHHKNLLLFCTLSEVWKYEPLEKADEPDFVMPPSYQVLMPNLSFNLDTYIKDVVKIQEICSQINPTMKVILVQPPCVDVYQFNLNIISKFPKYYKQMFHENEKYSQAKMHKSSISIYHMVSKMLIGCKNWPSKTVFDCLKTVKKTCPYNTTYAKFMRGAYYTMGTNGPYIDGINPKPEVCQKFWIFISNWLVLNDQTIRDVSDIPLPEPEIVSKSEVHQNFDKLQCLMVGDLMIQELSKKWNVDNKINLVTRYIPYANLSEIINLADANLNDSYDVLFLGPFLWEIIYLERYISSQEYPQISLMRNDFDITSSLEIIDSYTKKWNQKYEKMIVIWSLPYPPDFLKMNKSLMESSNETWNPSAAEYAQIFSMGKSFYSLVSDLKQMWQESLPQVRHLDLNDCFFQDEAALQKTFIDENTNLAYPEHCYEENGFYPSEILTKRIEKHLTSLIDNEFLEPEESVFTAFEEVGEDMNLETDDEYHNSYLNSETGYCVENSNSYYPFHEAPPYSSASAPPYHSVPAPPYHSAPAPPYHSAPAPPYPSAPAPPYPSAPAPPYPSAPAPPYPSAPDPLYPSAPAPPYPSAPDPSLPAVSTSVLTESHHSPSGNLPRYFYTPQTPSFSSMTSTEWNPRFTGPTSFSPQPHHYEPPQHLSIAQQSQFAALSSSTRNTESSKYSAPQAQMHKISSRMSHPMERTVSYSEQYATPTQVDVHQHKTDDYFVKDNASPNVKDYATQNFSPSTGNNVYRGQNSPFLDELPKLEQTPNSKQDSEYASTFPLKHSSVFHDYSSPNNYPSSDAPNENVPHKWLKGYQTSSNFQDSNDTKNKYWSPGYQTSNYISTDRNDFHDSTSVNTEISNRPQSLGYQTSSYVSTESNVVQDTTLTSSQSQLPKDDGIVISGSLLTNLKNALSFLSESGDKPKGTGTGSTDILNQISKLQNFNSKKPSSMDLLKVNESYITNKLRNLLVPFIWKDLFLKGDKKVGKDVLLCAIKAIKALQNCERPCVQIIFITNHDFLVNDLENYLKPLIEEKELGINHFISSNAPIVLIDNPTNLRLRMLQTSYKDLSKLSVLIVCGDELITEHTSSATIALNYLIKLIYSKKNPDDLNRIVISESGKESCEDIAADVLDTSFQSKKVKRKSIEEDPMDMLDNLAKQEENMELMKNKLNTPDSLPSKDKVTVMKQLSEQQKLQERIRLLEEEKQKILTKTIKRPLENASPISLSSLSSHSSDDQKKDYDSISSLSSSPSDNRNYKKTQKSPHKRYPKYSKSVSSNPKSFSKSVSSYPKSFSKSVSSYPKSLSPIVKAKKKSASSERSMSMSSISDSSLPLGEDEIFFRTLENLGMDAEKKYIEFGKSVLMEHEQKYKKFVTHPKSHPNYKLKKEVFVKNYKEAFGTSYKPQELEEAWFECWKSSIAELKEEEWTKQREEMKSKFIFIYGNNSQHTKKKKLSNKSLPGITDIKSSLDFKVIDDLKESDSKVEREMNDFFDSIGGSNKISSESHSLKERLDLSIPKDSSEKQEILPEPPILQSAKESNPNGSVTTQKIIEKTDKIYPLVDYDFNKEEETLFPYMENLDFFNKENDVKDKESDVKDEEKDVKDKEKDVKDQENPKKLNSFNLVEDIAENQGNVVPQINKNSKFTFKLKEKTVAPISKSEEVDLKAIIKSVLSEGNETNKTFSTNSKPLFPIVEPNEELGKSFDSNVLKEGSPFKAETEANLSIFDPTFSLNDLMASIGSGTHFKSKKTIPEIPKPKDSNSQDLVRNISSIFQETSKIEDETKTIMDAIFRESVKLNTNKSPSKERNKRDSCHRSLSKERRSKHRNRSRSKDRNRSRSKERRRSRSKDRNRSRSKERRRSRSKDRNRSRSKERRRSRSKNRNRSRSKERRRSRSKNRRRSRSKERRRSRSKERRRSQSKERRRSQSKERRRSQSKERRRRDRSRSPSDGRRKRSSSKSRRRSPLKDKRRKIRSPSIEKRQRMDRRSDSREKIRKADDKKSSSDLTSKNKNSTQDKDSLMPFTAKPFQLKLVKPKEVSSIPGQENIFASEFQAIAYEDKLKDLEGICSSIGMMGAALKTVVQQAKEMMPDVAKASLLFKEPDTIFLVNHAIKKLLNLDPSKYSKVISSASELLGRTQKPIVNLPKPTPTLDLQTIAKATMGKSSQHVYQFIKNSYLLKGFTEPSKQTLDNVFKEVSAIHFLEAFK